MVRRLLGAVAAGAVLAFAVGAAQAETLADALVAAYKNSNLLDQNRALLRATDEDAAIAVASLRPVIAYTAERQALFPRGSDTQVFSNSYGLTAQMTLFNFGRGRAAAEAAKETVLATRQGLVGIESQVLLSAVSAYVDVRLKSEIVSLQQSNVRLISEQLGAAKDRFQVGEVTRTDVALAEARLAAARAGLAAAEGELKVAREAYRAATGAYPVEPAAMPAPPKTAASLDEATAIALREHWALKQAQHNVTVADLNAKQARAAHLPEVTASVFAGQTQGGLEGESASVSFTQPLYTGGKLAAVSGKALAGKDAARANLAQVTVSLQQNVANAWTQLEVSDAAIKAGDLQVAAAETAFRGVKEEADLGARTTLDVLDAEQDLLDARASRLEAEAQRHVGVYQLLAAMGLLTVDHLKLGIPTYDPAAYYDVVGNAPALSSRGAALDRILKKAGE